jgi:microcystin-dependent protein
MGKPPTKNGSAPIASRWNRALKAVEDNLFKAIAAALFAGLALTVAMSWTWITQGGLIKSLGGITQGPELPSDAIIIVEGSCPQPSWVPFNEAAGRVLIGSGIGRYPDGTPLRERSIGQVGGTEEHTILTSELPPHNHSGNTEGMLVPEPIRLLILQGFTRLRVSGSGSGFQPTTIQVPQVREQTIELVDHLHQFSTEASDGLLGEPMIDNNLPPWIAVSFCRRG